MVTAQSYRRLRLSLAAMAVATTTVVVALAGLAVWTDRAHVRAQAEGKLVDAAVLIEEHAVGQLLSADQLAGRAALAIRGRDLEGLWGDRAVWEELRAMAAPLAPVVSIIVVDPQGRTVMGSRVFPTQMTDVSDRDYFRAHWAGEAFHIGATVLGRGAQQPVFTVSRRLQGPDGSFAGVVAVTLDAVRFARAFERTGLGGSAALAVIRSDGVLVAGHPVQASGGQATQPDARLFPALPSADGTVERDGRLVSRLSSERLPLVVMASLALDESLAPWRERAVRIGLASAAALLAIGGLCALLLRGLGREAAAWAGMQAANAALDRANGELAAALADKAVLFREVHHRVTNNLQVVSALLRAEAGRSPDAAARAALEATLGRVAAMALLHRVLYRTDRADAVEFGHYLNDLCGALEAALGLAGRGIALRVDAEPGTVDLDRAVPVGLMVNEAVTNAAKHAFPAGRPGTIAVSARRTGTEMVVEVRDDGVGMAAEAESGPGVGRSLTRGLARQAGATLEFEHRGGTTLRIRLPAEPPERPADAAA
ncbi:MAG TPA: histidine kinase dimerization/phosphoacceptor domain -containing protein [Alphaproteobacteria bacterium]|nr:histidine kinase dimerization/phosphoacceptor domain -containing protein [Alphaproteobacteria bacterium]